MRDEGAAKYRGVLYIGIMLAEQYDNDPVVIEYNVRFGDPEAQVILPVLESAGVNIYELFKSAASNNLDLSLVPRDFSIGRSALTVCLAASGYPGEPQKGHVIEGWDVNHKDVIVHHGSTSRNDKSELVTNGGRVLYVTGLGETIDDAAKHAYDAIGSHGIHFDGMQYRTDIGSQIRT